MAVEGESQTCSKFEHNIIESNATMALVFYQGQSSEFINSISYDSCKAVNLLSIKLIPSKQYTMHNIHITFIIKVMSATSQPSLDETKHYALCSLMIMNENPFQSIH